MKLYIKDNTSNEFEDIFGMADLAPKHTGLKERIWSDHSGCLRKVSHRDTPRVKVGPRDNRVPVSISKDPKILINENEISDKKLISKVKSTFEYISRNYDLFLKHYFDITDEFGDDELKDELSNRGDYK